MIREKSNLEAIAPELRAQLLAEIQAGLQQLSIQQLVMISGFIRISIKTATNSETT